MLSFLAQPVLVDNPFTGETESWANSTGFERLGSFHWFKHFSRYIRPGMERVGLQASPTLQALMVMAFVSPEDGSWTVVLINGERYGARVRLDALPTSYSAAPVRQFYSTLIEPFTEEKPRPTVGYATELRPQSITTIYCGPLD